MFLNYFRKLFPFYLSLSSLDKQENYILTSPCISPEAQILSHSKLQPPPTLTRLPHCAVKILGQKCIKNLRARKHWPSQNQLLNIEEEKEYIYNPRK